MYPLLRTMLFAQAPERAHTLTLAGIRNLPGVTQRLYGRRVASAPVELMGLVLDNPLGLAAGFDKDGVAVDGLAALGFGFVELGTVTPVAQSGNPKPRVFRLAGQRALINRLGFNNQGAAALADRLAGAQIRTPVGVNIGRNRDTPAERAIDDYRAALAAVFDVASYVTVNISSPNTQGLRDLQGSEQLDAFLGQVVAERDRLNAERGRYLPLAVKIAPDLDGMALSKIAASLLEHRLDGVIATNTTTARAGLPLRWSKVAGGMSGAPLRARSTAVIAALDAQLAGRIPIIGAGGIQSGRDAVDKLRAGATAVQLYTGLVYRGPALVRECVRAIRDVRDQGKLPG